MLNPFKSFRSSQGQVKPNGKELALKNKFLEEIDDESSSVYTGGQKVLVPVWFFRLNPEFFE